MDQFMIFTGRNMKLYFRDRGAVLFSFLSALIVICLMIFFLGDMNIDDILDVLELFSENEEAVNKANAELLVLSWTCAGIISINAVTVSLAVYSGMIKDRVSGKLNAIYTAPISRLRISLGYVMAAWTVTVLMCLLTLIVTEVYGAVKGLELYTPAVHVKLVALIMLNAFVYAALMYPLALVSKTEGAWSGFGTVIGTLVGFLGGIYIPIGTLSAGIAGVMKCTPIIYGTSLFRSIMTQPIVEKTFAGVPEAVVNEYRSVMGIRLTVWDYTLKQRDEWMILLGCGMIFLVVGMGMLRSKRKEL